MAPAYTPLSSFSSSAMISQARNFGAPERVPAGSTVAIVSTWSLSSSICPVTTDAICMTLENRWIFIYSSTSTVPNLLNLPISFRARSTNILCSASSLSSSNNSFSNAKSSAKEAPLGLVPATGNVVSVPSTSLTNVSGLTPAISISLHLIIYI